MASYPTDSPRHPLARLSRLGYALHRTVHPGTRFTVKEWHRILMMTVGVTSSRALEDYTIAAEGMGLLERVRREGVIFTGDLAACQEFLGLPADP